MCGQYLNMFNSRSRYGNNPKFVFIYSLTNSFVNCEQFSILGNIASATDSSIESVVSSGPGLVFITYPEVVLRLPGAPFWAIIFFMMLVVSLCT
jgi:solute carrier family 6 GABA transporter-like protein 1